MAEKTSRRAGTAPTLSDVAQAAGVSPMTVSRVINKDANVRAATRERVEAAITALNYAPNTAARLLAGATRARIALVYGNPSAAYLSEVLLGCLSQATRSDAQLLLVNCEDSLDPEEVAGRVLADRPDGVILPSPFCDTPGVAARLLAGGVAVTALASGAAPEGASAVTIDDRRAAADMTRRLLDLGHRRIGFISGARNQVASIRRLEGFRQALAEAGVAADEALVAAGDFTYRSGLTAAHRLLDLAPRPTAIFASNDDMAAAVVAAAHRRHLDVPEDLSVCGFDDTALATTIFPELTTVHQPVAEMAQAAVEILADAARRRRQGHEPEPEFRLFPHEIVRRQSDATARS